MAFRLHSRACDLGIRLTGLALLPLGAFALMTLYQSARLVPQHETTALEFGLAALGFACFSVGLALLALGCHIADEVEIAPRWARRYDVRRQQIRESIDEDAEPADGAVSNA